MTAENDLIVKEYSKTPINNFALKQYTIKQHEGNFICWDDITVYLLIDKKWKIEKYSFDWNCSTITKAAASFLSELIIWKNIDEILKRDHQTMIKNWFNVSPKRKRAAVIAILAARNAIHNYKKDNKVDNFDDLIDD